MNCVTFLSRLPKLSFIFLCSYVLEAVYTLKQRCLYAEIFYYSCSTCNFTFTIHTALVKICLSYAWLKTCFVVHGYELTQTTWASLTFVQVSGTQAFFYFVFIEKFSLPRIIGFVTSGVTAVQFITMVAFLDESSVLFFNACLVFRHCVVLA